MIFDNATVTYNKNLAAVDLDLKTLNDDSVIDLHINVLKPITMAWVRLNRISAISIVNAFGHTSDLRIHSLRFVE